MTAADIYLDALNRCASQNQEKRVCRESKELSSGALRRYEPRILSMADYKRRHCAQKGHPK